MRRLKVKEMYGVVGRRSEKVRVLRIDVEKRRMSRWYSPMIAGYYSYLRKIHK